MTHRAGPQICAHFVADVFRRVRRGSDRPYRRSAAVGTGWRLAAGAAAVGVGGAFAGDDDDDDGADDYDDEADDTFTGCCKFQWRKFQRRPSDARSASRPLLRDAGA